MSGHLYPKEFFGGVVGEFRGADFGEHGGSESRSLIICVCRNLCKLLLEKNNHYGDTALNPKNYMSKASTEERLLMRIDDKLNRFIETKDSDTEDTLTDLIGYLILLKICRDKCKNTRSYTEV